MEEKKRNVTAYSLGCVYAVEFGNVVKIGFTTNFEKRIKSLKTQLHYRNEKKKIGRTYCSKEMHYATRAEAFLHESLKDRRIEHTELFKITFEEAEKAIKEVEQLKLYSDDELNTKHDNDLEIEKTLKMLDERIKESEERIMEEKVQESVAVFNGIEMRISSLDDIWLTQNQIAQLFDTSKQNVGQHIKAFLKELDDEQVSSVVKESFTTTKHGAIEGKEQTKKVNLYNFDVICQIGYRTDCKRGFKFRQFVTKAIREKLNRDLLNRDEVENALRIENENLMNENNALKARLGEAVIRWSLSHSTSPLICWP